MSNKEFKLQNFRADTSIVQIDGYVGVSNADGYTIDTNGSWTPGVTPSFVSTGVYLLTLDHNFKRLVGANAQVHSASTSLDLTACVDPKNAAGARSNTTPATVNIRLKAAGTPTNVGQNNGFSYSLIFKNSSLPEGV